MKNEIEYWCEPDDFINAIYSKHDYSLKVYKNKDQVSSNGVSVRLICDLPERKIEISESEFDEATEWMRQQGLGAWVDKVKQKLFDKSED